MVLPAASAPVIVGTDCMMAFSGTNSQIDVNKCVLNPTLRTIEVEISQQSSPAYVDTSTLTLIIKTRHFAI